MPFFEAVVLALNTIRVQKLKSFFTLIGVTIGVMFLIAVVSIVEGMSNYVENDFAGKLFGVNTFTFKRQDNFVNNQNEQYWREVQRRPLIYPREAALVKSVLPEGSRS
ncbi:MAG: ABC transporter permease, partial [Gemmatimonadaceae bacterium]